MPTYTKLRGISNTDDKLLIEQLSDNLTEFFNWGFLEAGGYTDVSIDPTDVTEDSTLAPVHMAGQPDGRIWQAKNINWVWEKGLESERQPVAVSGVYVGGAFQPSSGVGAYKHFINYPEGRVVFDQPIPTTSVVQAAYSYKWVNFYNQNVPWFRDVIFDAYRYEVGPDAQPSGVIGLLEKNRVQLPAMVVETVGNRRMVPRQMGDLSQFIFQDFLFHVLAEDVADRDFLIDAVTLQKDKTILLFDANARQFGLDWRGSPVAGAYMYPDLLTNFFWKKAYFSRMVGQEASATLPLFRAVIRVSVQVEF